METIVKTKMIRSNASQVRYLVHYMSENRMFAAGEFRGPLGSAAHEAEWLRLKEALDELGPVRSVKQWKLCWRDQKKKARAESGKINKTRDQTGNNSIVPELSQNSEIVLGTIGQAMAVGHGPAESPIGCSETRASCFRAPQLTSAASCSLNPPPDCLPSTSRDFPSAPARRTIQHRQNAGGRRLVRRVTPPEKFLNAQLQQIKLLTDLVNIIESVGSELVYAMKEANAIAREKLGPNK